MFLEYFVWGAWSVQIGSYMNGCLGFSGKQIGWIFAATALGALVSPVFVGYIADRYFSTERIFAVLHVAGAVTLFLAATATTFPVLMTLIVLQALCYMPTLPLANSLAFRNIDDPTKFPRIIVGGTIGWIVAGLAVGFFLGGASGDFFYCAAGAEAGLALYGLALPHTPPKGREAGDHDVLGLTTAKLLRRPAFLVFAIAIPLATISATFYTTWMNAFLGEIHLPRPTALMTLSQISGVVVLLFLPWFIAKIGMKAVLVLGMVFYAIRYLLFTSVQPAAIVGGLLLHGFSYDFVIIGASIYAARVVPPRLSARAQSFIALLTFGVGQFAGAQIAGIVGQSYSPQTILVERQNGAGVERLHAPWPAWEVAVPGSATLPRLLGGSGDSITLPVLMNLPERGISIGADGTTRYTRKDLVAAFRHADHDADGVVTKADWERSRRHTWPPIWIWGAGLAVLSGLLFWLGGREPQQFAE
jgi:nucleoside transporter